ncbi:hypothetical protein DERP_007217 [Dermatophagoides pteronyssinus]|uniref:Uncharacterized protein n=1 Tax=Dermatophagoides pteronyssinus TaxID=6956 RepID=A0ABQ8J404_DERPT|nr:hypothetical protein DERP_007217 [Dermatophagoides pteronyssinus]
MNRSSSTLSSSSCSKSNHPDSQCLLMNRCSRTSSTSSMDRMIRCILIIIVAILLLLIAVSGLFMLLISSVPNDFPFLILNNNNNNNGNHDHHSNTLTFLSYYSLAIFQLSLIITEVIIALSIIFIIDIHNDHQRTTPVQCLSTKTRTRRRNTSNRKRINIDDDIFIEDYYNDDNDNDNLIIYRKQFRLIFILKIILIIMISLSILLRLYTSNLWQSWICNNNNNCYDQQQTLTIHSSSSSSSSILSLSPNLINWSSNSILYVMTIIFESLLFLLIFTMTTTSLS